MPGVVEVNPIGGYRKETLIAPDPAKLLAYGLTIGDLQRAVAGNNTNRGAGYVEQNGQQWLVRVPGQAVDMADIGAIVVHVQDGVPLRVRDIASVQAGRELRSGAASQNGHEVVLSTVFMLLGENSRTVSKAVAAKLDEIKTSLPPGITVIAVYDRTTLGRSHAGRHRHHHLRLPQAPFAKRFIHIIANHHFGHAGIGNHAIFHWTIRNHALRRATNHELSFVANCQHFVILL